MKTIKYSLIVLFICFLSIFYGQNNKQISIPAYKDGDTTLWYKWQHERDDKLKLPHLILNTDSFHFRFWTDGQAIDIWTTDNNTFHGLLTNYTDSYEPYDMNKKKDNPPITFSNQTQLDSTLAHQVYGFIKTISSIPSGKSIKNWGFGHDGITYLFETSTPTHYSFKEYWSPDAQDSALIEAKQIQTFVDTIYSLLNLRTNYNHFFTTLKPGSYTSDHFMVTIKFTEKQNLKWKKNKPYRDYLESIEDTLNNYLSDTLNKILHKNGESFCLDQFLLKFSKKNKLKKIATDGDFIDFADRMDCYKCRRKLRKAFRQIHFDFVHSKVSYWKVLENWNKKITIR